jgi:hypothetical protein
MLQLKRLLQWEIPRYVREIDVDETCLHQTENIDDFEYCPVCGEFVSMITKEEQYLLDLVGNNIKAQAIIQESDLCVAIQSLDSLCGQTYRFALSNLNRIRVETMCTRPPKINTK